MSDSNEPYMRYIMYGSCALNVVLLFVLLYVVSRVYSLRKKVADLKKEIKIFKGPDAKRRSSVAVGAANAAKERTKKRVLSVSFSGNDEQITIDSDENGCGVSAPYAIVTLPGCRGSDASEAADKVQALPSSSSMSGVLSRRDSPSGRVGSWLKRMSKKSSSSYDSYCSVGDSSDTGDRSRSGTFEKHELTTQVSHDEAGRLTYARTYSLTPSSVTNSIVEPPAGFNEHSTGQEGSASSNPPVTTNTMEKLKQFLNNEVKPLVEEQRSAENEYFLYDDAWDKKQSLLETVKEKEETNTKKPEEQDDNMIENVHYVTSDLPNEKRVYMNINFNETETNETKKPLAVAADADGQMKVDDRAALDVDTGSAFIVESDV